MLVLLQLMCIKVHEQGVKVVDQFKITSQVEVHLLHDEFSENNMVLDHSKDYYKVKQA